MEIFQWLDEKESWEIISCSEGTHLKEELSDVMVYLFMLI